MGILWGKRIRLTFLVATTSTNTSGPGLAALHKKPRVANPPLTSDTPRAARLAMLLGIFVTSALWRSFLSVALSMPLVRANYQRCQHFLEPIFGAILCLLGLRLVASEVAANFAESPEFGNLFLEFIEITQLKSCGVAIVQIHDQDPSSACYAWKQKSLNAQLLKLLADLHGSFKFAL